ncbi:hypothetical protein KC220_26030, partial [Mycobacterium tuberculosis]|nr:hypothetical protein [Mycobacterium tuberculosis]
LPFVGRFKGQKVKAVTVAEDIRSTLGIDVQHRVGKKTGDLYSYLVFKTESAGILVFKNGIVSNNTRRPLSVAEFRGFVVTDE